jgi:DNA-binding response OmpR family regulator
MGQPEKADLLKTEPSGISLIKNVWFDTGSGEVRKGWEVLHKFTDLQATAFQTILEHPNVVLTYEFFLNQVWKFKTFSNYPYIDEIDNGMVQTTIARVRKSLSIIDQKLWDLEIESNLAQRLENIQNRGYRWNDFSQTPPYNNPEIK